MKKRNALKIHPKDNVAVVTVDIAAGGVVFVSDDASVEAVEPVPAGHKVALADIPCGGRIIKCGESIGAASADIGKGSWVHTHNVEGMKNEG